MLAQVDRAVEEGVQALAFPRLPGLDRDLGLLDAFFSNVIERAPGMTTIRPRWRYRGTGPLKPFESALGRTLVLDGDDCLDPRLFADIRAERLEAIVYLIAGETAEQSEAIIEFAIDVSLHMVPVVIVSAYNGSARGTTAAGIGAIVRCGEVLAEGGAGEDLLVADVPASPAFEEPAKLDPVLAPVLEQRLADHRAAEG